MTPIQDLLLVPVPDDPRTRDYQARTDRSIDEALQTFDVEQGLSLPAGEPAAYSAAEVAAWDRQTAVRKRLEPGMLWYYEQGRSSSSIIGRMAWCWQQPLSRYYRSDLLLRAVRNGLGAFREHQEADGAFAFAPGFYTQSWGSHEMAWRLEPLIYACVWAREGLSAAELAGAREMIRQGAEYLLANPCQDPNNRGAVWSAVVALCGQLFGEQRLLDAAWQNWQPIRPRMFQGGQVMEDTGPDSNYSYTGVAYAYLWRRFADDASLDDDLCQVQQWFARMRTLGGIPFEGMSSRMRKVSFSKLDDLLPMLERYAHREPFYTELVDRYLGFMDDAGQGHHTNHGCDMRIWAMMEHQPDVTFPPRMKPAEEPAWFREVGGEYKTDATLYAVIKRRYQGMITLRAALPLKGLQTWAWGKEPPVIHPGLETGSGTVAWGIDTAALQVSKQAASGVWADREWQRGAVDTYSMRQETIWTHYVFTPVTTLVIIAGKLGPRVTTWAVNTTVSPAPTIRQGVMTLAEQQGRLYFRGEPPSTDTNAEAGIVLVRFPRQAIVTPFAFSDRHFAWDEVEPERLSFRDSEGRYTVSLCLGDRQKVTAAKA